MTAVKRQETGFDGQDRKYAGVERPAAPAEDAEKSNNGFDCDSVWQCRFSGRRTCRKGSFYIIGSKSRLTGIHEHTFTVAVTTEYMKKIVREQPRADRTADGEVYRSEACYEYRGRW